MRRMLMRKMKEEKKFSKEIDLWNYFCLWLQPTAGAYQSSFAYKKMLSCGFVISLFTH